MGTFTVANMIKLILTVIKKVALFLLILFCVYLIFLVLEDLNDLIFHSYKTRKVFWPFDNKHFLDLDYIVKYVDHFWAIITNSLVLWVLLFGAVIPYFIKLFRTIKGYILSVISKSDLE